MENLHAVMLKKAFVVSLSLLEACVGRKDVEDVIKIIFDIEIDVRLFSKQVPSVNDFHTISGEVVKQLFSILATCKME